jgi:hypothetical protein
MLFLIYHDVSFQRHFHFVNQVTKREKLTWRYKERKTDLVLSAVAATWRQRERVAAWLAVALAMTLRVLVAMEMSLRYAAVLGMTLRCAWERGWEAVVAACRASALIVTP